MSNQEFFTGIGTNLLCRPLPNGISAEPVPFTLTLAAAVTKGATTITLETPPPAGAYLLKGEYIGLEDADGLIIPVQCSAFTQFDGVIASVPIYAAPAAIEDAAVAELPHKLAGRTSASISREGNRVTLVTFDNDGFESGRTSTRTANLTFEGAWLPSDPGYANVEFFFMGDAEKEIRPLQQFYFWVEMPNENEVLYSKGVVYKGAGSITSVPLENSSEEIIMSNIEAAFNGRPVRVAPTPVA